MDSDLDQDSLIGSSDEEFPSSESDTDDECTLEDARNWCKIDDSKNELAPPRFPFRADPGIKVNISDPKDVVEYFRLFVDEEILDLIVKETNRYAEQHLDIANLTPTSRSLKWQETNKDELNKFIALLILQGVVEKPVERWFWSKRPILNTPFFGQIMSIQRYTLLMKFLHFENNKEFELDSHPNPTLRKIYDLSTKINTNFQKVYQPKQDVAVAESLLGYKGLLGWKQYIPSKRASFGIKIYQLCESESGYIYNFFIYTGKGTKYNEEYNQYNMSTKSVLTLAHNLLGKGYTLITDSFYTSPELADILIKQKTDLFGTLRANRKGLPPQIKNQKLKKGETIGFQKGKVCAMKWQDKKPIRMLSTIHNIDIIDVTSKGSIVKKPSTIVDYNNSMGGVDLVDQCLSYYKITRNQQRKYYKKIFRHLLNQCIWNAFVLFQKNGGTYSHIEFRMRLIERLIEISGEARIYNSNMSSKDPFQDVLRLTERHFPSSVVSTTSQKKHPVRLCVVCASKMTNNGKRVRRESRYQCGDCNVGLCIDPCFKIYHTAKVF